VRRPLPGPEGIAFGDAHGVRDGTGRGWDISCGHGGGSGDGDGERGGERRKKRSERSGELHIFGIGWSFDFGDLSGGG